MNYQPIMLQGVGNPVSSTSPPRYSSIYKTSYVVSRQNQPLIANPGAQPVVEVPVMVRPRGIYGADPIIVSPDDKVFALESNAVVSAPILNTSQVVRPGYAPGYGLEIEKYPEVTEISSESKYRSWGGILGWFLALIVLVLVIIAIVHYATKDEKNPDVDPTNVVPSDPVPPDPLNDPIGASDNGCYSMNNGSFYKDSPSCIAGPTRGWNHNNDKVQGSCDCKKPFYGDMCFRETYSNEYVSIGNPNKDDLIFKKISEFSADRMSFPFDSPAEDDSMQILCTNMCDQNCDCVGVIYDQASPPKLGIGTPDDKPFCTLIGCSLTIKSGAEIPFDVTKDATVYMKANGSSQTTLANSQGAPIETLKIKDRVFVWKGTLPLRYWLTDNYTNTNGTDRMTAMYEKRVYALDYFPTDLINDTGTNGHKNFKKLRRSNLNFGQKWTGIFSDEEFSNDPEKLNDVICDPETQEQDFVIVPSGEAKLEFPSSWKSLYGLFIDASRL